MIIRIKNLKAETLIGVYPAERKAKQQVVLNLAIDYDPSVALVSDKIEDALDYDAIAKSIKDSLPKQKFQLIESLAAHVAHMVLEQDRAREVTVSVEKTGVPAGADAVVAEYRLRK